jgi:predicted RNA-binding protein with TRAM domain
MSYGNRNRYDRGSSGRGSGYGYPSMNQGPKPVEIGKEYDVEVNEISRRGDGLAKVQGFVVFVKGSKIGEKVKIKIDTVGPRFATATKIGAALETSADADESGSTTSPGPSVTEPV